MPFGNGIKEGAHHLKFMKTNMVPNMREHSQIATKGMDENILLYCGSIDITHIN
jgi:hypothetical protein